MQVRSDVVSFASHKRRKSLRLNKQGVRLVSLLECTECRSIPQAVSAGVVSLHSQKNRRNTTEKKKPRLS